MPNLSEILGIVIVPALRLLPTTMDTPEARVQMLTIGLQESKLTYRYQVLDDPTVKGPARGLWQFERGGGVKGVMTHPAVSRLTREVCLDRGCRFDATQIWHQIERDDVLAAALARLLIYTHPKALPRVDDPQEGWDQYIETWRPGKPHRSTWNAYHLRARKAVVGA